MSCADVQTIQAGNGTKTLFSFDFPYILKSEIHVYFWNATTKDWDEILTTDSTYPWQIDDANPTIVEFTGTAPPIPPTPIDPREVAVDNILIRRITNTDDIRALFNPGSAIRSDDLNKNFEQLRFSLQEANCSNVSENSATFELKSDTTPQLSGNLDVNGNTITGLPNAPSSDNEAVSKKYVDDTIAGIDEVVEDITPQLGGDLDVNGKKITSVSNGNIVIDPDGTGNVVISKTITSTNNGNISIDPDGTGILDVNADALIHGITVGRGAGADSSNTAIGANALYSNTIGNNNTANGADALRSNDNGANNTANGYQALYSNTAGIYNTANGVGALYSNLNGFNNTADGAAALYSNTTGGSNSAFGAAALSSNISGNSNTAIGTTALQFSTGNQNVAIGAGAGYGITTGSNNTIIGDISGTAALSDTVIIGAGTTERLRIDNAGNAFINGITFGRGTNAVATNTAVGFQALISNYSTGYQNTANGYGALQANNTGFKNTANGFHALYTNTTGIKNTAIGSEAGKFKIDGTSATAFDNCTYLGYNTRASGSNQVQLGDSSTSAYYYNNIQNRSDARDKADIRDTLLGLDFIKSLRPVDFRWDYRDDYFDKEEYQEDEIRTRKIPNPAYTEKGDEPRFIEEEYTETVTKERWVPVTKDGSRKRTRFHHGLIAQEVKSAADAQGVDFAGYQDHSVKGGLDVLSLGYTEMIAPLIKAVQQLSAEIETLQARLTDAGL